MCPIPSSEPDFAKRVVSIIAEQACGVDKARIVPTATLAELEFDSFGAVNLMFALEEAFGVEISDDDLNDLKTVDDVIRKLGQICDTRTARVTS